MNEVALDQGVSRSDARLSTSVRHYKLARTRAKQRLWHDRQRLWNDEVRELGDWLAKFHWQVYATPSFRLEVSRVQARSAVQRWLRKLGSDVYAYVTYEEGKAGGRTHAHALIGGLGSPRCQRERNPPPSSFTHASASGVASRTRGRRWECVGRTI